MGGSKWKTEGSEKGRGVSKARMGSKEWGTGMGERRGRRGRGEEEKRGGAGVGASNGGRRRRG